MARHSKTAVYMAVGIAVGTAIGMVTDNIGLWLALGIAVGAGLSVPRGKKNKSSESDGRTSFDDQADD